LETADVEEEEDDDDETDDETDERVSGVADDGNRQSFTVPSPDPDAIRL
jgi:hypothetical protein